MATEFEKSIYKWIEEYGGIKLILFSSLFTICSPLFLPIPFVFSISLIFIGFAALVFGNDYRKWKNTEDPIAYINRNSEIRKIIKKYKSIINISPQSKIRLDELKEKNRVLIEKTTRNTLSHCDDWGIHDICIVCGNENIWHEKKKSGNIFKDIEFCGDCGYLKMK